MITAVQRQVASQPAASPTAHMSALLDNHLNISQQTTHPTSTETSVNYFQCLARSRFLCHSFVDSFSLCTDAIAPAQGFCVANPAQRDHKVRNL